MKTKKEGLKIKKRMSIMGIGTYLIIITFFYLVLIMIPISRYPRAFHFSFVPRLVTIVIGIILMISGSVFLVVTLRTFAKQFYAGRLVTSGPFTLCRNPIYASWILLIIPGISFLLNSWLVLSTSLIMYILFKINIGKEEKDLVEAFGADYEAYKSSVNELLPLPRLRNKNFIKSNR